MRPHHLSLIVALLFTSILAFSASAFIDSPLDWLTAPAHTRGLVCPSQRYGCCPDLHTWRLGSPCASPKPTENAEECFRRREWACCQVEVRHTTVGEGGMESAAADGRQDDVFTCTTGFRKVKDGAYGWRSGTREKFLGVGRGVFTREDM